MQKDLKEVFYLQRDIKEAMSEIKQFKRRLRHLTHKLSWEIEHHWAVEKGEYDVELQEKFRKVIDWKNELGRLLTEGTVKEIEDETVPRIYKTLKVTRRS